MAPRRRDEEHPPSPEHGDAVTVGNLPTMYVRVSSSALRTPAGKEAGVIGFNVWMTPVNGPFQQAIDIFRSADGLLSICAAIPVVSPR